MSGSPIPPIFQARHPKHPKSGMPATLRDPKPCKRKRGQEIWQVLAASGCPELGFGVWGLGFGVWGLGFGVWGLGFGVWGLGFRV